MTLEDFVSKGWQDHAHDAAAVFARLHEGVALVSEPRHLPAFAALVVHVAGEHMGRWADGVALLDRLQELPAFDANSPTGKAVLRSQAILHRCAGDREAEERCAAAARGNGALPEASERIRILAIAAAAFLGQRRVDEARRDLEEAVALAAYGPTAADPAARAIAVTAHNLAVELENRPALSDEERALMLRSASVSRDFWRICGGWTEHERAEYRLAMSHVKAGDPRGALHHAEECLRIVDANGSEAGEAFFAREALSRARLLGGDRDGARRDRDAAAAVLPKVEDASFRDFCAGELARLDGDLRA